MKTTLLTNVYNEEYLLPFWLNHHKDMFDDIIIVNYRCTDDSLNICRRICPRCKIIDTKNPYFSAVDIDKEFMELENDIEGVKIILNTTEFLFTSRPIKDFFTRNDRVCYSIKSFTPYSKNTYEVANNDELFRNLLTKDDIVFHDDRYGTRQLHNFKNGSYWVGRHFTNNPTSITDQMYVIWLGFYPLNDRLLKRKLQICEKVPDSDVAAGFSYHHRTTRDKLLADNLEKSATGFKLPEECRAMINKVYPTKHFIVTGRDTIIGRYTVEKLLKMGHHVVDSDYKGLTISGVYHLAEPTDKSSPTDCYQTKVSETLSILELCKNRKIPRIVFASSNEIYGELTPYKGALEAAESLAQLYIKNSGLSIISLRYSEIYGYNIPIYGADEQVRDYTHIDDIVSGNLLAMQSRYVGTIDLCTGISTSVKDLVSHVKCPKIYKNRVKHIFQCPKPAYNILNWKAKISFID